MEQCGCGCCEFVVAFLNRTRYLRAMWFSTLEERHRRFTLMLYIVLQVQKSLEKIILPITTGHDNILTRTFTNLFVSFVVLTLDKRCKVYLLLDSLWHSL